MTEAEKTVLIAYGIFLLVALSRHVFMTYAHRRMIFLKEDGRAIDSPAPLVSIMVPAKDEAKGIENCIRSLLEQDYPNFEVLVVDDRSTDNTAEIVERIANETGRVRLVRIKELPAGWTGKTHALHVCTQSAKGEWFLFVDADTRLERACVRILIRDAIDNRADLESMLPSLECNSFWERTIQPFAGVCLMVLYPLHKVNDPQCMDHGFANGQFILMRRTAYEKIGGHESVRDKFVEDIHLGRRTREFGLGLRVVMAPALASVRMYSSLREIVRGWSRILYSAVNCKPAKLYGLLAAIFVFSLLGYGVVIVTGTMLALGYSTTFLWWLFAFGVAHCLIQDTLMARVYAISHSSRFYLLFRLFACVIMVYVVLRAIRMCSTHEVIWRGTQYAGKDQALKAS